ncbi:CIS tube protein [Bacteroides fragilis]|uniref:Contractile injection system tube protein N-terminal domain-containing protein n=1 Tax=Bacteroides fragilis TaxID=817 RepID=A0A853PRU1_BACFG|nr:hypothetical protein [Bacteroides fragilis]MCS2359393.1 hypothetical protein [Bacteroides fragilis]OCR29020.1 hypothetical protein AC094_34490 [Bacteroides fragilis]PJY65799.1 hypothetical protein CQW35_02161 [Bacteroides fragilis]
MKKMQITAYTDDSFNTLYKTMELPVSPDKVKLNKGIRYAEDKQLGSLNGSNVYVRYQPETLYFECLLDVTNALEEDKGENPVHDTVDGLEGLLYDYNTEGHRPSFVKVEYGDIAFFGQLKTLETEYSLFNPKGLPLRAELKVTLTGYCCQKEEKKHFSKRSPDVSRLVTLKEGQTLASLCYEIYGDALLVGQVARFNNLNGYRSIPAGTQLLMPMLKKE